MMDAKNPDDQPICDRCNAALDRCKTLDTSLAGMQNRLSLGLPVNATMNIIEWDLHSLDERIKALRKAVGEEITVEV